MRGFERFVAPEGTAGCAFGGEEQAPGAVELVFARGEGGARDVGCEVAGGGGGVSGVMGREVREGGIYFSTM